MNAADANLRASPPLARTRPALPHATLRLQLSGAFGFEAAEAHVAYFAALGISHVYASPILTARAGSSHGYDVVDHRFVNPELGGEDGLRRFVRRLHVAGIGLIVDIVPNHMAVGGCDNPWWLDVLEWGPASPFARFFDIDWSVPDAALAGRVLLPFLRGPYGEALARNEIALAFENGRFHARHFEHCFPIAPRCYPGILRAGGEPLAGLAALFAQRHQRGATRGHFEHWSRQLAEVAAAPAGAAAIAAALRAHAADGDPGRDRLHRLLEQQHYRLAWWRTASDEINWRRFFDITSLARLRMDEPAVFEATHATTFRLYEEGLIDGLRIDHIDGLADPRGYCRRVRARLAHLAPRRPPDAPRTPAWVIVEKILAPGEKLRRDWRVDGTTGYTFMNEVNALLHDPDGQDTLTRLWIDVSGRSGEFPVEERRARRRTVEEALGPEWFATARALHRIARSDPLTRDITLGAIRRVLMELLVNMPVYRVYADRRGRSAADEAVMARVRDAARAACRPWERPLVDVIDRWLGGEPPAALPSKAARHLRLEAIGHFQQLSSPVAAKAVEDTAFYRHGRLLSRNEVGADPAQFSMCLEDFHAANAQRRRRFPATLLATATHDHKRGEDVRARLAVLSEMPARWAATVQAWCAASADLRVALEGISAPDAADEYMLYQMLVGAWPLDLSPDDAAGLHGYGERLAAWQEKAVREAKLRSAWIEPNLAYEAACRRFLASLLDPAQSAGFLADAAALVDAVAPAGAVNGLAQTLLRMTAPGVPDLYQGTEWWDFSLVDPDNRRPVDFARRTAALRGTADWASLLRDWRDGRVKQQLIARTLALRAERRTLFTEGDYVPLGVRGPLAARVVAFARIHGPDAALVAIPRFPLGLLAAPGRIAIAPDAFRRTTVPLPRPLRQHRWTDALTGEALPDRGAIALAPVFERGPVMLLAAAT